MSINIPVFAPNREDEALFEFDFARLPEVGDKIVRNKTLYEIKEIRHLEGSKWAVSALQTRSAPIGYWQENKG